MKYIFVAVTLALTVGIVTGRHHCSGSKDCKEGECCVVFKNSEFKGASCTKLGEQGEKCEARDDFFGCNGGVYFHHCPCADGFECKPEKEDSRGWTFNKRCKRNTTTTTTTTTTSSPTTTTTTTTRPTTTITTTTSPTTTTAQPIETSTAGKSKITDDEWDDRGLDESDED